MRDESAHERELFLEWCCLQLRFVRTTENIVHVNGKCIYARAFTRSYEMVGGFFLLLFLVQCFCFVLRSLDRPTVCSTAYVCIGIWHILNKIKSHRRCSEVNMITRLSLSVCMCTRFACVEKKIFFGNAFRWNEASMVLCYSLLFDLSRCMLCATQTKPLACAQNTLCWLMDTQV